MGPVQSENDASSAGDGGDIEANDTASNGSDKNLLVSRGIPVEADSDSERSLDCSRCCSRFGICGWAGVIIFVALTLGLLIASFQKLESTQYGLQYHPRRKELDEAAKTGGLHVGSPGFKFVQFPSTYIVSTFGASTTMLHPLPSPICSTSIPLDCELERRSLRLPRWATSCLRCHFSVPDARNMGSSCNVAVS